MHCESTVRIKGSMSAMAQPMESTMDRWRVCLTPAQASSSPIPPQPQSTQPQCHRPETQPQPSKRCTFPPPSCPGNRPHQSPGVATPSRRGPPREPTPCVSLSLVPTHLAKPEEALHLPEVGPGARILVRPRPPAVSYHLVRERLEGHVRKPLEAAVSAARRWAHSIRARKRGETCSAPLCHQIAPGAWAITPHRVAA